MECSICCESFSKTVRKQVTCPKCELKVCVSCVSHFCTGTPAMDVKCMRCNGLWDDEFLTNISRSFLKQQKARVEKLLMDQERSKLPETQYYLQYDRAMDNVVRPELHQCYQQISRCERELDNDNLTEKRYFDLVFEIRNFKRTVRRLNNHLENWRYLRMSYEKYIPEPLRNRLQELHKSDTEDESDKHVFPCTLECRGFVMGNDYQCGTCHQRYCKTCFQMCNDSHECKLEDIETTKLVVNTSKPCPQCAVRIHKIDGCDQMWCTHCNTAFSWITGKITQDDIHNPHYFEWFRKNGSTTVVGAVNRNPCDRRPVRMHLLTHLGVIFTGETEKYDYFTERIRLNTHIRYVEIDQHFVRNDYQARDNLDLRIRWLKNEYSEKHFGRVLCKRHKECMVNARRVGILRIYIDASDDIFRRLLYECQTAEDAEKLVPELDNLIGYVNTCMNDLRGVYHMKMPVIRFNWNSFELGGYTGYLPME